MDITLKEICIFGSGEDEEGEPVGDVIIMEGVGESGGEEPYRTGVNSEVEQQLAPPLNTAGISQLLELPHHQTEDAPTTPVQPEPPDIASGLSHKVIQCARSRFNSVLYVWKFEGW